MVVLVLLLLLLLSALLPLLTTPESPPVLLVLWLRTLGSWQGLLIPTDPDTELLLPLLLLLLHLLLPLQTLQPITEVAPLRSEDGIRRGTRTAWLDHRCSAKWVARSITARPSICRGLAC